MFIIEYTYSQNYINGREEKIMARPQKRRCICSLPQVTGFAPQGCDVSGSVNLTYDEYEVIRQISRPTVTRIYDEARRKIADMLANGRALTIAGGDVFVCPAMRPECAGEEQCCHKNKELSRGVRAVGDELPDE